MVGSTAATPLGAIKAIMGSEEVIIRSQDIDKFMNSAESKVVEEQAMLLKSSIIEGIIDELRSLPPSKHFLAARAMKSDANASQGSLRQQIIEAIERDNRVTKPFVIRNNEASINIKINHPLAAALNWGTGEYNKDDPHLITPKEKRYMFIPGERFMAGYYAKKAMKMGYNTKGMFTGR
jgi:hypothetical protein